VAEAFAVYRRLVGARIRSDLQYRASFVLYFLGQFGATFLDFLAIAVVFGQIELLAGWTFAEVAFLYGTTGVAFNLADIFVSEVEYLAERIRTGTFDRLLLRPISPLLQLLGEEFALRRFGRLAQSSVVLGVAMAAVDVDWTIGRIVAVPALVFTGAVIFGAIWVIVGSLAFWTTDGNEVANAFTYGGNLMTQYPMGLYGRWLLRLLGFFIPLAFVNYFPALYVLGRDDTLGAPDFVRFLSPVVGVATVVVARLTWGYGIRRYTSTGS
jgi:ABC-2 type transport system permease protein